MTTSAKCLIAAGLMCLYSTLWAQDDPAEGPGDLDSNTVVVFPIEILTVAAAAADLAEQETEELLRQLHQIDAINIIGPDALGEYADSELSSVEIARRLGAAHYVESDIRVNAATTYLLNVAFMKTSNAEKVADASGPVGRVNSTAESATTITPTGEFERVPFNTIARRSLSAAVRRFSYSLFPELRDSRERVSVDREQALAEARAAVVDSSRSNNERLQALDLLHGAYTGLPIDTAAVTEQLGGAIARAAADMATNSNDTRFRSRVWLALTGVRDEYLIDPLLQAAPNDFGALQALAYFREVPRVRDTLVYLQNSASSEPIRRAAHRALLTDEEIHEELRATALDRNAGIGMRRAALNEFVGLHRHALPLDQEFTLAMVEFVYRLRDPRARWAVWDAVRQGGNEHFAGPAVEALANEPDESVRDLIVRALAEYGDYPGVFNALEAARISDPSPVVKKSAQEVLQRESGIE